MKLKVVVPDGYKRLKINTPLKIGDLYANFFDEIWDRFSEVEIEDNEVYDDFVIRKIKSK